MHLSPSREVSTEIAYNPGDLFAAPATIGEPSMESVPLQITVMLRRLFERKTCFYSDCVILSLKKHSTSQTWQYLTFATALFWFQTQPHIAIKIFRKNPVPWQKSQVIHMWQMYEYEWRFTYLESWGIEKLINRIHLRFASWSHATDSTLPDILQRSWPNVFGHQPKRRWYLQFRV